MSSNSRAQAYLRAPYKTFLALAFPALFSLVAEPLTALADTAFIARLGTEPLAALGIGTMLLSCAFWVFSFLGVGTQTELANALGRDDKRKAARICGAALVLAISLGLVTALLSVCVLSYVVELMGASGSVHALAEEYILYRLIGAPAMLVTITCFGALRGLQDMRTPLYIAAGMNGLNILFDWMFIFGIGPLPPLGVGGAAMATSFSQWVGAVWGLYLVVRQLGISTTIQAADIRRLLRIGGDVFVRTGVVMLFLTLSTRAATQAGAEFGAAHQAIRQFFIFGALFLDANALTGQSLIGFFFGRQEVLHAVHVAKTTIIASLVTGVAMTLVMLLGQQQIVWLLVPSSAVVAFSPAWIAAAWMQPLNALASATDGIHWGTGDFRFLRNIMIISVAGGGLALFCVGFFALMPPLVWIWLATGVWLCIRVSLGLLRIWPGIWMAPLRKG